MNTLEILFFVLLFIVFYTYVGYGILLWILVKIKQSFISFYDTDEPKQETPAGTATTPTYPKSPCSSPPIMRNR